VKLSDFDFKLPEHLIAQHPAPQRDHSRLMLVRRSSGGIEHRLFHELPEILNSRHFLVLNNTKVLPARLWASRPGKDESIEVLLVQEVKAGLWRALARPGHKTGPGAELQMGKLKATVEDICGDGTRLLRFANHTHLMETLEESGQPPLPPYIRRFKDSDFAEDRVRYQTVYARHAGSVAAPTAGLHFTPELLERLAQAGVRTCEILLHVGYGTFKPVRCENIESHHMDPEYFEVGADAARGIVEYKLQGRRLVAVGSTVTRVLEHLGRETREYGRAAAGYCDLFIFPGHRFQMVDALLTNFHLPRSTLFILVCAFAGRDLMLECYRRAIADNYRFFSYGDCMLIF
jgi:S-adenosylmethionine:tRNA ribosyltransferase-isomerase